MTEQRSVTANRDLWAGMKMLLFVAAAILVVSNVIFAFEAAHTGGGLGFGDTALVPNGQIAGGPAATIYHEGFWADAWKIVMLVVVDVGLLGFWYAVLRRLKSI